MTQDITIDPTDIKRIIRGFYEQLSTHKLDSMEEIEQLLRKHKLSQIIQHEINNFNSPVTIKEIELIILKIPPKNTHA